MAHILLVEDDLDLREMLKAILADEGHHVVDVSDGQAALAAIRGGQSDLIVSDIIMDGMEGIAAIMAFRKLLPETPIIAMSGNELYLSNSEKLGADLGLLKPFTRATFLSEINALLDTSERQLLTAGA
ncbi:response regulator [Rhodospirillales bacterium]|nr:response regulator [Rhodospirillales bacterium]